MLDLRESIHGYRISLKAAAGRIAQDQAFQAKYGRSPLPACLKPAKTRRQPGFHGIWRKRLD